MTLLMRLIRWLRPLLPAIVGALAAAIPVLALVWSLGSNSGYRAGVADGRQAAHAEVRAERAHNATRQLEDRLNAQTSADDARSADERLCGPSARDCRDR